MGFAKRTKARKFAMQMVFQILSPGSSTNPFGGGEISWPEFFDGFWQDAGESVPPEGKIFCEQLVKGSIAEHQHIDGLIAKHSAHWRLERMPLVDLSILRIAVYEVLYLSTPLEVVLNEAVELAKKFSSEEASGFVNGVLDAIAHEPQVKPSEIEERAAEDAPKNSSVRI